MTTAGGTSHPSPSHRDSSCSNCGAGLHFMAGVTHVGCPHCGTTQLLPPDETPSRREAPARYDSASAEGWLKALGDKRVDQRCRAVQLGALGPADAEAAANLER